MKKYFMILVFILILSTGRINRVKAESFYEDNWITGVYANLIDGDFSKPQLMRFIRRKSDNKASYCISPRVRLYESEEYTNVSFNQLNISDEKFKRLNEIAYFGYGYKNHTSNEWYAITQFMIWKEVEPNMDIFFTDKFKGNRITRFESEMKEVYDLISQSHKIPNIKDLDLLPNTKHQIYDDALKDYKTITNGVDAEIVDGNKLNIITKSPGNYTLKLTKNINYNSPLLYKANEGQNILVKGDISDNEVNINIKVSKGTILIHKIDAETDKGLDNITFDIYDKNHNYIKSVTTSNNGYATIGDLTYGEYILIEKNTPIEYYPNEEIHVLLDKDKVETTIINNPKKSKFCIHKTLKDDDISIPEENIKFKIYDINNNYLDEIVTNNTGDTCINLRFGTYKLVQQNTTLGYEKHDPFYIDISELKNYDSYLIDNRIKAKLIINKKDNETKEKIDTASFKIKDILKDEYINNGEIYKTKNGTIELDIKGGKYVLEEVKAPINYIKGEDIEFVIDDSLDNNLVIDAYNVRKKGKIKITKYGKSNNNSLILLNNVEFNVFDDNKKLVDTIITNKKGIGISKELELGNYTIIEKSTLDNFILDKTEYEINLEDDIEDDLIIDEIIFTNEEKKYYCSQVGTKYYNSEGKIVNEDEFKKSCIKDNTRSNIHKDQLIKDSFEAKESKNIDTIYPTTSDIDMYIYIIIGYISFIGLLYLIASIKNEK